MLLSYNDYVRAYRVIRSVIDSYPKTDARYSCIAFAIGGMRILRDHYHSSATISVGGAVYRLGPDEADTLAYGKVEGDEFVTSRDAFHCWVSAEDYYVDFMAPLFPEVMKTEGRQTASVPRMFQRRHSEKKYLHELTKPGDFAYESIDQDTAVDILYDFLTRPSYEDMWNTMSRWFARSPRRIASEIELYDTRSSGTIRVPLSNAPVDGSW